LRRSSCHLPTTVRALAAGINAFLHIACLLAALGAFFTDVGANCAGAFVKVGAHQHKVSCGLTDFRTSDHYSEVAWLDVTPACLQAMVHGCA